MKKILFVVGPALGHVGRSLVIARSLSRIGGSEIHFAGVSPGYAEKLIPNEFLFHPLKIQFWGDPAFAIKLEKLMQKINPDIICLDINPMSWLYLVRFPEVPQVYFTNWFLTKLGKHRTNQDKWFKKNCQRWNGLRSEIGLKPLVEPRQLYERNLTLLCDPPCLAPQHDRLPSNMRLVGSCSWELKGDIPNGLKSIEKYILVSFGSTGRKKLNPKIPEAIANDTGCETIVWLDKQNNGIESPASSKYQHLNYSWLPLSQVTKKAAFVITQGGTGSTYQAISNGVPVGTYHTHNNQKILGDIVEAAGVGLSAESLKGFEQADTTNVLADMKLKISKMKFMTNGPEIAAKSISELL